MRFVIAMMKHESNTFSPVPTRLDRFGPDGAYFGEDCVEAFEGGNQAFSAYLDLAREEGAEFTTPVAATALPSGPVDAEAYEAMAGAILADVGKGCDALLLDLHGAMVSEAYDDGEGELLTRIREAAPGLPIAVALDLHTNLTEDMVANCTAMVGYKTYPHIDKYEVGAHAGRILLGALAGEVEPAMAWGNKPMLPHTLCMGTDEGPMKDLVDMARQAEETGEVLAATAFGGFPLADIHNAGASAVVVADGNVSVAEAVRDRLLDAAWERREAFVYHPEPLSDSIARAKALEEGPVLLIDHADNAASGGTQDTMAVVAEIMRQGLDDVAVAIVADPGAVSELIEAGVGAEKILPLGGKVSMPALGMQGRPHEVAGTVRVISNGEFTVTGPMNTGMKTTMGRSVMLDAGSIQFVVTERNIEPWDLGVFHNVGIDPTRKKYLVLKSRIHYRAAFMPIAKHVIECDGVGVTGSDYSMFKFEKLRRPIYPLDDMA
ncbi:MAG: M81 family metallopeptidase [Alphaproteobacteria bacterium]|jgi:microcystin degradation protein MlrC|nr:M81 family metallopeptidase [Alphaproteobacteria bacterium]